MKHDRTGVEARILKLAVLAVGGQGGGVLTDWITELAESQGWWAQATSVAGVAQRTGATIYYVEMVPADPARPDHAPIFSLSPAPDDVDILLAAELAEAGRAMLRGFVTPQRTTLIASSHRLLAVSEKTAPGDARAEPERILEAARENAARLITFDMEAIAQAEGSVISASLFGALAGSGALPFPREAFEATIRAGGRGVEPSLKAFAAAHDRARHPPQGGAEDGPGGRAGGPSSAPPVMPPVTGPADQLRQWRQLEASAAALPPPVAAMAAHGLRKVVDFQDLAYGLEYLDHLDRALDGDGPEHGYAFSAEAAKYLANAMTYDDILRVADLKTRSSRAARIRAEIALRDDQTLTTTEYFHPRIDELAATLPASLGAGLTARPRLMHALARIVDRGRRIRSDRAAGFALLWALAGLKPYRRRLLRHRAETAHREAWFGRALFARDRDYALGVEILRCRRLIKGYSDTHARGLSKFDRVMAALPRIESRPDAAAWLHRLRGAALKDPEGDALDGAIRTIASFAEPNPPAENGSGADAIPTQVAAPEDGATETKSS